MTFRNGLSVPALATHRPGFLGRTLLPWFPGVFRFQPGETPGNAAPEPRSTERSSHPGPSGHWRPHRHPFPGARTRECLPGKPSAVPPSRPETEDAVCRQDCRHCLASVCVRTGKARASRG
jgi:hypothetical protein